MNVPPLEEKIGINLYTTDTPGIGGVLRQQIEDFKVTEINDPDIKKDESGKHLIVELTKHNWETHHLLRDLSRILRISQKRIGFAGTKDKRALTSQRISLYDVTEEAVNKVHLKDVELKVLGRSNKNIGLGDLIGNEFEITVRNIDLSSEELENRVAVTTEAIRDQGGVPNFFGIQRFGARRPITHIVGESMVRADLEKAAIQYIAASFPDEPEETIKVRDAVFETRDYVEGLKAYPLQLRYERAMMHHLVTDPEDFAGALATLPPNICKMFVHGYQSCLYNMMICERIRKGLPLNMAVEGDIVCFKNKSGLPDNSRNERVTSSNLAGMNNLIKRKRAFVTAPLVGYDTALARGVPGEIEQAIIEKMDVPLDGFRIPGMEKMASRGMRREILLGVEPDYNISQDETNQDMQKMTLTFSLPRGSYATTVLREYMKTDPLQMS